MPKVRFQNVPALPRNVLLYEKGGAVMKSYAGKPTIKVKPHHWLQDGEVIDMPDDIAAWYLAMYPQNFSLVAPRKGKVEEQEDIKPVNKPLGE